MKGKFFNFLTVALLLVVLLCSCDLLGSKTEEKAETPAPAPETPAEQQQTEPESKNIWAVGNVEFKTLQEAVDYILGNQAKAATIKTGEVKLIVDNTVGEGVLITDPANITINLGGKSYSLSGSRGIESLNTASNITLLNGSLSRDSRSTFTNFISNTGSMTLNGITITAEDKVIYLGEGNFSILGGSEIKSDFDVKKGNLSLANSKVKGQLNIEKDSLVTLKNGTIVELTKINAAEDAPNDTIFVEDGAKINLNKNDRDTYEALYKMVKGDAEKILNLVLHVHNYLETSSKSIPATLFIPGYKCYTCSTCGEEIFGELATDPETGVDFIDEKIHKPASQADLIQHQKAIGTFRDFSMNEDIDDLETLLGILADFVEAVPEIINREESDPEPFSLNLNPTGAKLLAFGGSLTVTPSDAAKTYVYQDSKNQDVYCTISSPTFNLDKVYNAETSEDELILSGSYNFAFDAVKDERYTVKFSKNILDSNANYEVEIVCEKNVSGNNWYPMTYPNGPHKWKEDASGNTTLTYEEAQDDCRVIINHLLSNSLFEAKDLTATIEKNDVRSIIFVNGSIAITFEEAHIENFFKNVNQDRYYLWFNAPELLVEAKYGNNTFNVYAKNTCAEINRTQTYNTATYVETSNTTVQTECPVEELKIEYKDTDESISGEVYELDFDAEFVVDDSNKHLFFKTNSPISSLEVEYQEDGNKISGSVTNLHFDADIELKDSFITALVKTLNEKAIDVFKFNIASKEGDQLTIDASTLDFYCDFALKDSGITANLYTYQPIYEMKINAKYNGATGTALLKGLSIDDSVTVSSDKNNNINVDIELYNDGDADVNLAFKDLSANFDTTFEVFDFGAEVSVNTIGGFKVNSLGFTADGKFDNATKIVGKNSTLCTAFGVDADNVVNSIDLNKDYKESKVNDTEITNFVFQIDDINVDWDSTVLTLQPIVELFKPMLLELLKGQLGL